MLSEDNSETSYRKQMVSTLEGGKEEDASTMHA